MMTLDELIEASDLSDRRDSTLSAIELLADEERGDGVRLDLCGDGPKEGTLWDLGRVNRAALLEFFRGELVDQENALRLMGIEIPE